MRRMTSNLRRPNGEKGVATIALVISLLALVAVAGVGIDTSNMAFSKSKLQNNADAAAIAIANDCAANRTTCNTSDAATKTTTSLGTTSGATPSISSPLVPSTGTVTVGIGKDIDTRFFSAVGINNKHVQASATAVWNKHPISGSVLPFVVSLCQYAAAGINNPTVLRTDINDAAKDANFVGTTTQAYANMAPYLIQPACNIPAGVSLPSGNAPVTMLKGGLWVSASGNNVCNGTVQLAVLQNPPDPSADNETCTKKYNDPQYIVAGKPLLLAIYAPSVNIDHAGLRVSGTNAPNPASFGVEIVGFAPFIPTGWCFTSQSTSCGGVNPGQIGLAGKFVSTAQKFADFQYGDGVGNFGATLVELTN